MPSDQDYKKFYITAGYSILGTYCLSLFFSMILSSISIIGPPLFFFSLASSLIYVISAPFFGKPCAHKYALLAIHAVLFLFFMLLLIAIYSDFAGWVKE